MLGLAVISSSVNFFVQREICGFTAKLKTQKQINPVLQQYCLAYRKTMICLRDYTQWLYLRSTVFR